jgi:predicted enzyme related to lactoylglutathione lyase
MSTERTYPAGVTSWIDVEVGDLAAAQDFYGDLFG